MSIENIKEQYNLELSYRDSIPTALVEMENLLEDESVQRYRELSSFLTNYQQLHYKSDDEILDSVIEQDSSLEPEGQETYLCFGKKYIGFPKKIGGYYILEKLSDFRLHPGVKVAKYKNLYNPQDEKIIPVSESGEFESHYHIVFASTKTPEEEYKAMRRRIYKEAMKEKQLVKKAGDSNE